MTSMFVSEPGISLAITPKDKKSADQRAKTLNRFTKEDPTFQTYVDPESNQTIVQGRGELHLEVYIERMHREYRCEFETGMPQVAYREAITQRAAFNYTHKKQTGGSGQYGRVAWYLDPLPWGNHGGIGLEVAQGFDDDPSCGVRTLYFARPTSHVSSICSVSGQ
jgi:elongation factor G